MCSDEIDILAQMVGQSTASTSGNRTERLDQKPSRISIFEQHPDHHSAELPLLHIGAHFYESYTKNKDGAPAEPHTTADSGIHTNTHPYEAWIVEEPWVHLRVASGVPEVKYIIENGIAAENDGGGLEVEL